MSIPVLIGVGVFLAIVVLGLVIHSFKHSKEDSES